MVCFLPVFAHLIPYSMHTLRIGVRESALEFCGKALVVVHPARYYYSNSTKRKQCYVLLCESRMKTTDQNCMGEMCCRAHSQPVCYWKVLLSFKCSVSCCWWWSVSVLCFCKCIWGTTRGSPCNHITVILRSWTCLSENENISREV